MATKKRKPAKPAPRKTARTAKTKAKAPAPKAKAVASKVSASSTNVQKTVIRRDRGLEAEIAIAVVRGTTIAHDREWVHQDYHVDLPRRHMDMPPWPPTDFLFEEHVDTKTPHHDSNKSPEPKPPKKEGLHTEPANLIDLADLDLLDSVLETDVSAVYLSPALC